MGELDTEKLDAKVDAALQHSYHTRDAGWSTTAVKWWIKFHLARGEDPFDIAMPDAPHQDILRDEWRMMRFVTWLVEGKEPGIDPDSAAGYASTVQGFLGRVKGVKLGGGNPLTRYKDMLRGLVRQRGGKKPRKLRKALTPEKLALAFELVLDASNPLHANVRAALATMLQGLLRGGEAGVSDKYAARWAPRTHVTRGDVMFTKEFMEMTIAPLKNEHFLGRKACPVLIGRPRRGERFIIDATKEVLNMFAVDVVDSARWAETPMFRNPNTGRAFKVSELNEWVQVLMEAIGENGSDYGSHSARIGGATALFAAGASPLDIRTMGRWDSDIYLIYVRGDVRRAAKCALDIGRQKVQPYHDVFDDIEF